jgi:hypothetical protein
MQTLCWHACRGRHTEHRVLYIHVEWMHFLFRAEAGRAKAVTFGAVFSTDAWSVIQAEMSQKGQGLVLQHTQDSVLQPRG